MNTSTKEHTKITLPPLPYPEDALEPQISAETLSFHHGKHHQTYVNNLNMLIAETPYERHSLEEIVMHASGAIFNNAAQVWNHTFYFESLSPSAPTTPTGILADAINRDFGSTDNLKSEILRSAISLFGSGWVWLAADKHSKLSILPLQNAGTPLTHGMTPLLAIDVWEHAYYIDYRNRRADSVGALWDRVNWAMVERRLQQL